MVIGIALVALAVGIGALCVFVCRLAVDALPAFAACLAGFWAYSTGAGLIGAIMIGVAVAAVTVAAGRLAFGCSRSATTRAVVAFVFAAPAACAGYHGVLGLAEYGVPSDVWRHVFAVIGAFVIGVSAMTRLAGPGGLAWPQRPSRFGSPIRNQDAAIFHR